ncbi:hypothetical protein ACFW04_008281 [Cataglyphis niger]
MLSRTVSCTRQLNYYIPIQDAPPVSEPRRAVRILGRKYALIPILYKYLEILISVAAVSCMELFLGDNWGSQIALPFEMWKSLKHLIIEVVKISDSDIIKITMYNNSLYMKLQTVLYLFDFERCIDHMYYWLCENTYIVNEKFKQFVKVLQHNNITNVCDAAKAILENDIFNRESLIDCELLACVVNDILCDASNK